MICQPRENALMITGTLQRHGNTRSTRMWKHPDCIYYDAVNNKYYLNIIVFIVFINYLRTVTKKVIKQTTRFLSFLAIIAVRIHSQLILLNEHTLFTQLLLSDYLYISVAASHILTM